MSKYLVGVADSAFSERDFVVVDADSPEEAVLSYIKAVGVLDKKLVVLWMKAIYGDLKAFRLSDVWHLNPS